VSGTLGVQILPSQFPEKRPETREGSQYGRRRSNSDTPERGRGNAEGYQTGSQSQYSQQSQSAGHIGQTHFLGHSRRNSSQKGDRGQSRKSLDADPSGRRNFRDRPRNFQELADRPYTSVSRASSNPGSRDAYVHRKKVRDHEGHPHDQLESASIRNSPTKREHTYSRDQGNHDQRDLSKHTSDENHLDRNRPDTVWNNHALPQLSSAGLQRQKNVGDFTAETQSRGHQAPFVPPQGTGIHLERSSPEKDRKYRLIENREFFEDSSIEAHQDALVNISAIIRKASSSPASTSLDGMLDGPPIAPKGVEAEVRQFAITHQEEITAASAKASKQMMDDMERKHASKLNNLRQQHARNLDALNATHDSEIEQMRGEVQKEKNSKSEVEMRLKFEVDKSRDDQIVFHKRYTSEITQLKDKVQQGNEKEESIRRRCNDEKEQMKKDHKSESEKLKKEYEAENDRVRDSCEEHWMEQIVLERTTKDNRINILSTENAQLKETKRLMEERHLAEKISMEKQYREELAKMSTNHEDEKTQALEEFRLKCLEETRKLNNSISQLQNQAQREAIRHADELRTETDRLRLKYSTAEHQFENRIWQLEEHSRNKQVEHNKHTEDLTAVYEGRINDAIRRCDHEHNISAQRLQGHIDQLKEERDTARSDSITAMNSLKAKHSEAIAAKDQALKDDRIESDEGLALTLENHASEISTLNRNHEKELRQKDNIISIMEAEFKLKLQAANKTLKADVEALRKALVVKNMRNKAPPDRQIAETFKALAQEVDDFASTMTWDPNKESTWPFHQEVFQRPSLAQIERKLKRQITQTRIWLLLYEHIFATPFRILGDEGRSLEQQWSGQFSPG
jgi:hypothetical protein